MSSMHSSSYYFLQIVKYCHKIHPLDKNYSFFFFLISLNIMCLSFTGQLLVCLQIASEIKRCASSSFLQMCFCSYAYLPVSVQANISEAWMSGCTKNGSKFSKNWPGNCHAALSDILERCDIFDICEHSQEHQNFSLRNLAQRTITIIAGHFLYILFKILKYSDTWWTK